MEPTADAVSTESVSVIVEEVAFELRVFESIDTEFVDAAVHVAGPEITKEPVPCVVAVKVRLAPTWITVAVLTAVEVLAASAVGSITQTPAAASEPAVAGTMYTALAVSAPAFAGATDVRTPSPNAATATSATRLKFVFVDMFFLSLVRFRNFLDLARRSFDLLIPFLL
jgi:hypothetical protein